ncbi:MAG: hypothetical protein K0S43_1005 [Cellulosimicrobium sp.]|nr:hypothetical protein [Cellulosimicrobium sp.]
MDQAERELVEVAAVGPLRDLRVLVVEAVAVGVGELRELVPLRDEDRVLDDLDAHGVEQLVRDLGRRDVLGAVRVHDAVEEVHLAGHRVGSPAAGADLARRHDGELLVRRERQARDLGLEALGAQVDEVVVGVDRVEAQAVAGRVGRALAVLVAGRGHAHDARLGAERRRRDHLERGAARRLPREREALLVAALVVVDPQVVHARRERRAALDGGRVVRAVVLDDELAVDVDERAVVVGHAELVLAVGGDVQVRAHLRDEVVLRAELLGRRPVDGRHELVDVGRLAGLQGADPTGVLRELEGPQRDAGLLLGEVCRGGDGPARDDHGAEGEGGRAASVPDPAGYRQAGAFEHRCSLLGRTSSPRSVTPAWPRR